MWWHSAAMQGRKSLARHDNHTSPSSHGQISHVGCSNAYAFANSLRPDRFDRRRFVPRSSGVRRGRLVRFIHQSLKRALHS